MLALFASILAATATGGPAPAELCQETTRLEREIADGQRFRRDFGMPASRQHVLRVIRSGAKPLPGGGVPLSPMEAAYLRRRDRPTRTRAFRRAYAYARAQRETYGGLSLQNDYPRGAIVLIRFTRDVARQRATLEEIADFPLRVKRVAHSERELQAIQRRVDIRGLGRKGVDVLSIEPDIDRSRVLVSYVSRREDAGAVIRRPFGDVVTTRRISRKPTYLSCASVDSALVGDDDRTLELRYTTGLKPKLERVFVDEDADRVRVGIVERYRYADVTDVGYFGKATAVLSEPLGDREIVDAQTGEPLARTRTASDQARSAGSNRRGSARPAQG